MRSRPYKFFGAPSPNIASMFLTAGPIPTELGQLAALQELELGRNQLTGESFLQASA